MLPWVLVYDILPQCFNKILYFYTNLLEGGSSLHFLLVIFLQFLVFSCQYPTGEQSSALINGPA
jgi:hypothetical protein